MNAEEIKMLGHSYYLIRDIKHGRYVVLAEQDNGTFIRHLIIQNDPVTCSLGGVQRALEQRTKLLVERLAKTSKGLVTEEYAAPEPPVVFSILTL